MVKGELVSALDFQRGKRGPSERYSYRVNGQWYWCVVGPGYANTYRATEYDAAGLALLEKLEEKE